MGQAGRSRVSDDQLLAAAREAKDLATLLDAVGLVPVGGNYASVRRRLVELGACEARFQALPVRPRLRFDDLAVLSAAVAECASYAEVLRRLGLEPEPRHSRTLRTAVRGAGLSTAHFTGKGWSRGLRTRRPLEELLVTGGRTSSGNLSRRLLEEGVLARRCDACGLEQWRHQPVPLELDHVNGDRTDNRLANLRLLCPNCHALTDTWRGRNKGRGGPTVAERPP